MFLKKLESKSKVRRFRAFTLIEVLVAMFVLSVGLLGLAGITIVVLRSNTLAQQISQATSISTDLIERIKQVPFENLLVGDSCGTEAEASNAISSVGCVPIENSGLNAIGVGPNFWPAAISDCHITEANNPLGGTARWDYVSANFVARAGPEDFCDVSPNRGEFVRYYRISDAAAGQRAITAVTLWKDRFNKWRYIKLSTSRSP
ncbi:MAG: type IV pilus modification PilV family protein [Bdellovibrionota bacterium]